jgi:dTDP-4-dehydrorhamnose 3,5-epimerase
MIFNPLPLAGAFLIDMERREDSRGFFARTFCQREFAEHGLNPQLAQCSMSFSRCKGILRGMHMQWAPYEEAKLVRCTRGAIYDVIIDVRPASSSYCRWFGAELTRDNRRMLYVPEGFAHGFLCLEDETEVFYQMSVAYQPGSERGLRWNDPAFAIQWPILDPILSEKDRAHPDFVR